MFFNSVADITFPMSSVFFDYFFCLPAKYPNRTSAVIGAPSAGNFVQDRFNKVKPDVLNIRIPYPRSAPGYAVVFGKFRKIVIWFDVGAEV